MAGPVPNRDSAVFLLYQKDGTAKQASSVPLCTASAMSKAFTTAPGCSTSTLRAPPLISPTMRAYSCTKPKNRSPAPVPACMRSVVDATAAAAGAAVEAAVFSPLPQPATTSAAAPPATAARPRNLRRDPAPSMSLLRLSAMLLSSVMF